MTINMAYHAGGSAILISDFLVSDKDTSKEHINLPTFEKLEALLPSDTAQYRVADLIRKSLRIAPTFVIAGSGMLAGVETIFRRLHGYWRPGMNLGDLRDYLELQELAIGQECTIVGHLHGADGFNTFRWISTTRSFEVGKEFIEGSGAALVRKVLPNLNVGLIDPLGSLMAQPRRAFMSQPPFMPMN